MNTLTDEQLSNIIKMPVEDLAKMKHYQRRSVSDRILFAAVRNDAGLWEDTTAKERAEQDVIRASKQLSNLEDTADHEQRQSLREHYLETCCQKCAILQHCKSIPECDDICKANIDNGRICLCGQLYVDNGQVCPHFKEIK